MFSLKHIPSPSSIFSAYASVSASLVLFRTMFNQSLPYKAQQLILSTLNYYWKPRSSSIVTLVIEETSTGGITRNEVYDASEIYLCAKISQISPNGERLKVSKSSQENNLTIKFAKHEKVVDYFEGMELTWRFYCREWEINNGESKDKYSSKEYSWFELSFHKEHKHKVLEYYLAFVLQKAKSIKNEKNIVKLHTLTHMSSYGLPKWDSINLDHPSNFQTLAMDPSLKRSIVEDLDRFVKRREFYKRVGKAWKRGYLVYGPPGTGKSSLVAAMANYLKFDVYDLQLSSLNSDSDSRKALLGTSNRSIIVVEDIDCSAELPNRPLRCGDGRYRNVQFTLSGLLNFIDGLWSSCGDERIIIFTTNYKDRLDPALLRPGRMDMHIHMSHCTIHEFNLLASNYLGIDDHRHGLFSDIQGLIENVEVTPAEVAEELMKSSASEDVDMALGGFVNFLKRKKMEDSGSGGFKEDKNNGLQVQNKKKMRLDNIKRRSMRKIGRRVIG